MRTPFTDRFGVEHPIVQAGMGREAGARLGRFSTTWEGRRDGLRKTVATCPPFGFMAELVRDAATEINWAGESAGLVDRVRPAAEIVRIVVADAEERLAAAARVLG